MNETWLSDQGDKAKTVELAPNGFDVKSFRCQSRSRGLGSNITFMTIFAFTHTSFDVVQA